MLQKIAERLYTLGDQNKNHAERVKAPTFHNTNRVARILYRLNAYGRLSLNMLSYGIPPSDILRSQFPYVQPNPSAPVQATVEFTNYCNLRCVYCTSPLGLRPRGFMNEAVLNKVVEDLSELGVHRVRVIGNGEPTLHPNFGSFVSKLCGVVPYVTVLTNGQWKRPQDTIAHVLAGPVRMVEVSVDAGDKEGYEASRVGGSFQRLLENLTALKAEKQIQSSKTVTNIRLMIRPSELSRSQELTAYWKQFGETVMIQHIVERKKLSYKEDVYQPVEFSSNSYPRCSQPFNSLYINWNGDVPLCSLSSQQVGEPGLIIGNVSHTSLTEIWNGKTMRQYREGHLTKNPEQMPICKGCVGA